MTFIFLLKRAKKCSFKMTPSWTQSNDSFTSKNFQKIRHVPGLRLPGGTFTFNLITSNQFHSWHSYLKCKELKSAALKWNQVERNPTILSPAKIFIKIRYVITDKFKVHNFRSLVHLFRPGDVKWPTMHELTDKVQIRLCHLGDPRRPSLNGQRFSAVLFVHAF